MTTTEAQELTAYEHAGDGERCKISPLDHGDLVCVHGARIVEVYL